AGMRRERLVTTTNAPVRQHSRREHYRPPVGVPMGRREWWGMPLSALAHVLLIALFLLPIWATADIVPASGAGGPGPAGGGGGGAAGARQAGSSASDGEHLHFVAVAPAPPALSAVAEEKTELPKPIPKPVEPPKPTMEKPVQEVKPVATPKPATIEPSAVTTPQLALAGTGAGTGDSSGASGGAGPGSGGGVGTGTGTGRGSATGPGTGGGAGDIFPATPDFLVMPALPVPSKVRGQTIRLEFQLDARGNITALKFNSTGDSGYDKELRARLMEYRFRPAHKADGTPVPSVYVTELTL
ncbi:MAG TPA: hypothetical protein VFK04_19515, partial [Gemmatimonadaceae bacterium]|nr:hypothetical protein [Gemmatimonadaceae bacterium]